MNEHVIKFINKNILLFVFDVYILLVTKTSLLYLNNDQSDNEYGLYFLKNWEKLVNLISLTNKLWHLTLRNKEIKNSKVFWSILKWQTEKTFLH